MTIKTLTKIHKKYLGRKVPVGEAFPPEGVLVICYLQGRLGSVRDGWPFIGYVKIGTYVEDQNRAYFIIPGCPIRDFVVKEWFALEANGIPIK
jgi:hypothetical protein